MFGLKSQFWNLIKTFFEYKLWWPSTKKTTRKILRKRAKLYNCLKQILLSHRSQGLNINKFTIFMKLSTPKAVSCVDCWIGYVVKSDFEVSKINDKVISLMDAVEN